MPGSGIEKTKRKQASRPAATGTIRPYRSEDRPVVREIFRRTAYRNKGSDSIFEDGEAFADYWTKYYTDYEPQSALVVEEGGEVIGYLLGCMDTRDHIRVMSRRIVPAVLGRALWRLVTFQYKQASSRKMLYWLLTKGWREVPEVPLAKTPAHYHCNILRKGHGKNYYSKLALTFVDRLLAHGVVGIHGQIEEAAEGGPWRQMLQKYIDSTGRGDRLEIFSEKPSTFQSYVLGVDKPMVNRAWGGKVEAFREWMIWTAKTFRL